ncbi:succinate--CoA ligase subunit alpha [Alkalihalobacillus sp. TS-13]|uniref:succinate--CoA ligase subunit alpha n=1 Tax=Alkalihalobacillus sp. TS-13 TaxID=2842455 RepID=UPI001C880652|nr:succinate--CoA ligase subunit alpha [Alkalihalobacillus sp. TS-13]
MSILVNENSKIIIQGITGKVGRSFCERMVKFNSPLVAGVTPGKGGEFVNHVPVYDCVDEAVKKKNADTSFITIPAMMVKQAVFEAIDAGIKLIVIYTEGVTKQDSLDIVQYAKLKDVMVLGPNSAGVVSPSQANVSDLHDSILEKGKIGIVSRSGTLTYEVIEILKEMRLGVSTVVCIGGDPIVGLQHVDVLELFEKDPETESIIYIGEIGGRDEYESAPIIKSMKKEVFALIAGVYAPDGKRMGHAGAIIQSESETAKEKQKVLKNSGAKVVHVLTELKNELKDHYLFV